MFQRTVMLVCSLNRISVPAFFFPPRHRLDKSRTSCSCYGRKRRKCAVSLGRSLPAGQIGRTRTRNGPRGVCWRVRVCLLCGTCRYAPSGFVCVLRVNCNKTQAPPTHTHTNTLMNFFRTFPSTFPVKDYSLSPSSIYCIGKYKRGEESRPEV